MKAKLALVLLVCLCAACATNSQSSNSITDQGVVSSAISLCLAEHEVITGEWLLSSADIDRAYVHTTADLNKLDVLFARGEVDAFGKRSANYEPFQRCSLQVSKKGALSIIYLGEFGADALIADVNIDAFDDEFYKGEVDEHLFEVVGGEFRYVRSRDFNPD